MAFAQAPPTLQDRRGPSPIAINLSSNNPFRRAASPNALSPGTPPFVATTDNMAGLQRKPSTNPFLDDYRADGPARPSRARPQSPLKHASPPQQQPELANAFDQFETLNLNERRLPPPPRPLHAAGGNSGPPPPRQAQAHFDPSTTRRPLNQDEHRQRMQARGPPPTRPVNVFAELDRSDNRRAHARRNSDSSVMDAKSVEEERKRRERRRLRAERDGGEKPADGKRSEHRSRRPNKKLDIIDRLDLTGIGGGAAFHHDGPFDACNPHRNRKGRANAPMQAFPAGSANNALGGSGPVNKVLDYDHYHGRQNAAFTDFSTVATAGGENARPRTANRQDGFNALDKVEHIHGDQSLGLGTSTFLEGAPASRSALQRRQSDGEEQQPQQGLSRKKSLAQKIRGGIRPRPTDRPAAYGEASRVTSPDAWPLSPATPPTVQSAGGRAKIIEPNPFFSDVKVAETKTGAEVAETKTSVQVQDRAVNDANGQSSGRSRAMSSPFRSGGGAAPRSSESSDEYGRPPGHTSKLSGSGFLSRVKSIKGKRSRPERSAN